MPYRYFAVYKPYLMLCQFTAELDGDSTLADLPFTFPNDVYTVGRLDKDSEGLLLLTNDGKLKAKLSEPHHMQEKVYYVQVEGIPSDEALAQLRKGVAIKVDGKQYVTKLAKCAKLKTEPDLPPRVPPIRTRKDKPTTWLSISITEGKNRQVRKMTAAVQLPTLRLVRVAIGKARVNSLRSGEVRELRINDLI
jgi:23S rRNA pseudouridine2457 synthase